MEKFSLQQRVLIRLLVTIKKSYELKKSKKVLESMTILSREDFKMKLLCISKIRRLYLKNILKLKEIGKKRKVIPLIFSNYLVANNIKKAGQWLRGYSRLFRNDFKVIESMLAKLMEHPEIKGNRKNYLSCAKRISVGEFKVSDEFKSIVKNNALNLQFKSVEESSSKAKN